MKNPMKYRKGLTIASMSLAFFLTGCGGAQVAQAPITSGVGQYGNGTISFTAQNATFTGTQLSIPGTQVLPGVAAVAGGQSYSTIPSAVQGTLTVSVSNSGYGNGYYGGGYGSSSMISGSIQLGSTVISRLQAQAQLMAGYNNGQQGCSGVVVTSAVGTQPTQQYYGGQYGNQYGNQYQNSYVPPVCVTAISVPYSLVGSVQGSATPILYYTRVLLETNVGTMELDL